MSRTNIVLNDTLIARAMELTGAHSKREAVDTALRLLVDKRSLARAIKRLKGRLAQWDGDLHAWRRQRS